MEPIVRPVVPVAAATVQAIAVTSRGATDRHILVATLACALSVPLFQVGVRLLQVGLEQVGGLDVGSRGLGAPLVLGLTLYAASGLTCAWLESLLVPGHRPKWSDALRPRFGMTWAATFLCLVAALPVFAAFSLLPLLVHAFHGDAAHLLATASGLLITAVVLFVWCLPLTRFAVLSLRWVRIRPAGQTLGWRRTRGNTLRLAAILTLVTMTWLLGLVIVFAGLSAGPWPVGFFLFQEAPAVSTGEALQIVLLETREIVFTFPLAMLLGAFSAVVYRHLSGGRAEDLGSVF